MSRQISKEIESTITRKRIYVIIHFELGSLAALKQNLNSQKSFKFRIPRKNLQSEKLKPICILQSFATIDARLTYLWSWPNFFFLPNHHHPLWMVGITDPLRHSGVFFYYFYFHRQFEKYAFFFFICLFFQEKIHHFVHNIIPGMLCHLTTCLWFLFHSSLVTPSKIFDGDKIIDFDFKTSYYYLF